MRRMLFCACERSRDVNDERDNDAPELAKHPVDDHQAADATIDTVDERTEAERRFEEKTVELDNERQRKAASVSYREQVEV